MAAQTKTPRVLLAGVWDLFHYGHAQAMENAKKAFPHALLVIGVHSDRVTEREKGKVVMHEDERAALVRHIKHVDEVVLDCPWVLTADFIQAHKIDWVVGSDDGYTASGEDIYAVPKGLGIFKAIPRIEGISATSILTRIVKNYDSYVHRNLDLGQTMRDLKIGYVKGMQIQAQRQWKQLVQQTQAWTSSNVRVSGFINAFGERMFQTWNVLGFAKEQNIRRRDSNSAAYPSADVKEETVPDTLSADILPLALEVCKRYVPGWERLDQSDLHITVISGGLTNKLFRCFIDAPLAEALATAHLDPAGPQPPHQDVRHVPHQVLLRIYGAGTETFFNRENEHKIFRTFAKEGLGPKLYGIFDSGRIEEFLELHSLDHSDLPRLGTAVAQQLAMVHMVDMALPRSPSLFDSLWNWLKVVQTVSFEDDPVKEALLKTCKVDQLEEELHELQRVLTATNSPVCFCHNDLIGGNIMYNDETKRLAFIDYEYGSYNYRGYDIGNHFCEWSLRYNLPKWPHFALDTRKYPSLAQQRSFLTAYLTEKKRRLSEIKALKAAPPGASLSASLPDISGEPNLDDPAEFEKELAQILTEANQFALASHYLWSLWAIIQASTSDIPFGYLEFASSRLADFRRRKDNFLYKMDFETPLELPVTRGDAHSVLRNSTDATLSPERSSSPTPMRRAASFVQSEKHSFVETHFSRPTWCGHCTYFVMSPFGKQGFACSLCGLKVHRHCVEQVTTKCIHRDRPL